MLSQTGCGPVIAHPKMMCLGLVVCWKHSLNSLVFRTLTLVIGKLPSNL